MYSQHGCQFVSVRAVARGLDWGDIFFLLYRSDSYYFDSIDPLLDGRRLIYLYSLPLLVIGSTGVALARTVPELLFWRFFQAVGAAPGMSVGIAVIGDIYMLEERGGAMGLYFSVSSSTICCPNSLTTRKVSLLGPALAPVAGGIFGWLYWETAKFIGYSSRCCGALCVVEDNARFNWIMRACGILFNVDILPRNESSRHTRSRKNYLFTPNLETCYTESPEASVVT